MLTRRSLMAGAAASAGLFAAGPAAAIIPLNALSNYVNGITTAQAAFTQINSDGTISTGTIYIARPGRARFDYNAPDETLVMAGGGQVAVFDGRSNSRRPEQYPLSQTPLNVILAPNVDFSRTVQSHREDGNKTIVTARDPARPQYGSIELVFTPNPIQLRQWVITDQSGSRTTVVLGELRTGVGLPARYFSIPQEISSRS